MVIAHFFSSSVQGLSRLLSVFRKNGFERAPLPSLKIKGIKYINLIKIGVMSGRVGGTAGPILMLEVSLGSSWPKDPLR